MERRRTIKFSIAIPTYTGEEHIEKCLHSLASQNLGQYNCEIVVVIDGPNDTLRQIVDKAAKSFKNTEIPFKVHQLKENQGRFIARKTAAQKAKHDKILFVDDRVTLDKDFIKKIIKSNEKIIMPNVIEASQPNKLSKLNYLLRRRIYGKKMWGVDFVPYYINNKNFERSPKGTTSLWIPKKIFLDACGSVEKYSKKSNLKHSNDDTKLLKVIIKNNKILRDSRVKIYYHPRGEFHKEAEHIYKRGPAFVDYYIKKGARFRFFIFAAFVLPLLLITGVLSIGLKFLAWLLIILLMGLVLASLYLSEKPRDFFIVVWTLPLISLLFWAGVIKGLFIKLFKG